MAQDMEVQSIWRRYGGSVDFFFGPNKFKPWGARSRTRDKKHPWSGSISRQNKGTEKLLQEQSKGVRAASKSARFRPTLESKICSEGALTISALVKEAIQTNDENKIKALCTRLRFWILRTKRISDQTTPNVSETLKSLEISLAE